MSRYALVLLVAIVAGCAMKPAPKPLTAELVFLTRGGCVNTKTMRANLDRALTAMALPLDYQFIDQEALAPADPRAGYPTPTVLLANRDLYGMPAPVPPFPEPS